MKKLLFLFFLSCQSCVLLAQNSADTVKQEQIKKNADDPANFLTRVEFFNELQHYERNGNDFYVNQTTLRTILRIGKRFTTRIDLPLFIIPLKHLQTIKNRNRRYFISPAWL
jgi:hypothetical protein